MLLYIARWRGGAGLSRAAVAAAVVAVAMVIHCPAEAAKKEVTGRPSTCAGRGCRTANTPHVSHNMTFSVNSTHTHAHTQAKPSKFDENIEDTIPVDIGENGTLIPDYDAKDKVGTIVLTKDSGVEDPPPASLESNAVLRKKFGRGKKKLLSEDISNFGNSSATADSTEKVVIKDIDGNYGARIEKRKSDNKTITVTVSPLVLKRRAKRPKRSPIQFYDDEVPYRYRGGYPGNKHRRYVRFPIGDFPSSGPGGFRPSRPLFNPFPDSIVPRSPRLVFRDPVEPGTLQASFFNPGNLQDISAPEDNRGNVFLNFFH